MAGWQDGRMEVRTQWNNGRTGWPFSASVRRGSVTVASKRCGPSSISACCITRKKTNKEQGKVGINSDGK